MAGRRRDNRGFLFLATRSSCRTVGRAGRRRAWGPRGCPARGGRATGHPCSPGCAAPARAPCTRGQSDCNAAPLAAPRSSRRCRPVCAARCAARRPGAPVPEPEERSSESLSRGAIYRLPRNAQATPPPPARASGVLASRPAVPRGPGGSADPTPAARSWKPEEGLQNLPGQEVRAALAEAEPVLLTLF